MKPETAAIHVAATRPGGAVAPGIHLSTTFEHGPANEAVSDFIYIRHNNPNVAELEAKLTALEGGIGAVSFASGMAAGAALMSALKPNSVILFHSDLYYEFRTLTGMIGAQNGLEARFADMRNPDDLAAALTSDVALVWFETPSNPLMDVIDIARVSDMAHRVGAKVLVDGTFATPALQRPFDHGADFVLHSLTKYMGGHSDVQGGSLSVRDDRAVLEALYETRKLTGGVLSPFNAWLIARGLQTLHCRMDRHSANALAIADALSGHPRLDAVRYPWTGANAAIAKTQMRSGGGMLSLDVKGGREAAIAAASRVNLFVNATSLGGNESLLEHRLSVEGSTSTAPAGLLRLSIGLEHADDLIADLRQALDRI